MRVPLEKLEADVLDLPPQARARLAHRLIASLDDEDIADSDDPADIEREWEVEIERRLEEYDSGRVRALPAAEVMARIRRHLT